MSSASRSRAGLASRSAHGKSLCPSIRGTALCSAFARAINASGSAEPAPIDTAASTITAATHTTELIA